MTAIDFEQDKEEIINKTRNVGKLADKIQEMQAVQKALEADEEQIKQKKKTFRLFIRRSYSHYVI